MYKVYIYDNMQDFTAEDLSRACEMVSSERFDKIMSYIYPIDRNQSAIAELLLSYALRDAYSISNLPDVAHEYNGKPVFKGKDVPCFNISHCKLAVACAVSDECVGIDIEPYSSFSLDVAQEVFNDKELAYVDDSPERFAELWTIKESYLKYTGEGLTDNLKSLLSKANGVVFDTFHSLRGYACTVCVSGRNIDTPTFVNKKSLFNGRYTIS